MIQENEKNVTEIALAIGAKYFSWATLLIVPLSMASCAGGLVGGSLLVFDQKSLALQILGGLVMVGGLTSTLWMNRLFERLMKIPARKTLRELISFEREASDAAIAIAGKNCYYNATHNGAMAVDAVSKNIGIVLGVFRKGNASKFERLTFTSDEILAWSAVRAGAILQSAGVGAGPFSTLSVHKSNLQELASQTQNTGLLLKTTNLQHPEILMKLDFDQAKSWMLVLEKFAKGRLDIPANPTVYPF